MRLFGNRRRKAPDTRPKEEAKPPPVSTATDESTSESSIMKDIEAPKQETAVPALTKVNVLEFGVAKAEADEVMLAGYCPISDELESCRWEIIPTEGAQAPKFRIIF